MINVVDVNVEVDMKEVLKRIDETNRRLEEMMDDETRAKCEEIKKLSPDEQRKLAYETIKRIEREFREHLKGRDYIG